MSKVIGIRYEDKYTAERRVAIIPDHIKHLKEKEGLEFLVETSEKRVFNDETFRKAGAEIVKDVRPKAEIIFGVKEMPIGYFEEGKTYIFFSHTIKGQPYNMPLLKDMVRSKINLIEYEKVADEKGRRLIFFGKFAGLAGMINSLWSLGKRYQEEGIDTPLLKINQSHTYASLEDAKAVISGVGKEIAENGLPKEIPPIVIGVTGYGNVSVGSQEIIDLLPVVEVSPEELKTLESRNDYRNNMVYKVVFKEHHLSQPIAEDQKFELQDYYDHPEKYKSIFEQYIPHFTILMNCMYWDNRYPKIVTREYLRKHYNENHKMKVIGDVTCDPNGSIECTFNCTMIEDPVFVYNPEKDQITNGFSGKGLLIMAVDILPSELPKESSETFSNALLPYVKAIASADYHVSFEELEIPEAIKRAMILHNGEFTPDYKYMEDFIN